MKLVYILLLMILSACSDGISITTRPVRIDIGQAADPAPVSMLPVNFRVVTRETLPALLDELSRTQGSSPVFIAITVRDYENLALNFADLRRYIEQQRAVVVYYRQMTSSANQ